MDEIQPPVFGEIRRRRSAMKLGIVGLPNVGKSTRFNSLTKAGAESANYPFCTIDPNIGIVPVPDERLKLLGDMYHSKKVTPAVIEFVDIEILLFRHIVFHHRNFNFGATDFPLGNRIHFILLGIETGFLACTISLEFVSSSPSVWSFILLVRNFVVELNFVNLVHQIPLADNGLTVNIVSDFCARCR